MADTGVRLEREGAVATIVIDQPARRNALRVAGWEAIGAYARALRDDSDVRVVVITGAGDLAFSAGADISEFEERRSTPAKALEYNSHSQGAFDGLTELSQPLIAKIRGACMGGGCELALMADIRLASDDAMFGIPAARLGISIGHEEVRRLVHAVGPAYAREVLFTGGHFDAGWALRTGLVNGVYPGDTLDAAADQLVRKILDAAPTSVRWAKQAIAHVLSDPALREIGDQREQQAALFGTEDFKEGVRAFMEKRPARFTGR